MWKYIEQISRVFVRRKISRMTPTPSRQEWRVQYLLWRSLLAKNVVCTDYWTENERRVSFLELFTSCVHWIGLQAFNFFQDFRGGLTGCPLLLSWKKNDAKVNKRLHQNDSTRKLSLHSWPLLKEILKCFEMDLYLFWPTSPRDRAIFTEYLTRAN